MIGNDMEEFKQKFAVLVVSCDKYSDLWDPFFSLFEKNWSGCPYDIYLGSNTIDFKKDRIKMLFSGKDIDWANSTMKIVSQLSSKYLLILLEDMFIGSPINTAYVEQILSFMQEVKAKHIHIRPLPPADHVIENIPVGIYNKGMPYRVNVMGFWEREYFLDLLIPGETPWQFEIMGSYRAVSCEGFYCLNKELFKHVNMVEKGCWIPKSVKWCRENGVNIDISRRKLLTGLKLLKNNLQVVYFNTILKINWKIRVNIMNILRKILISY